MYSLKIDDNSLEKKLLKLILKLEAGERDVYVLSTCSGCIACHNRGCLKNNLSSLKYVLIF